MLFALHYGMVIIIILFATIVIIIIIIILTITTIIIILVPSSSLSRSVMKSSYSWILILAHYLPLFLGNWDYS